jgi:drug/metabolite transporter (DMT)-like permease
MVVGTQSTQVRSGSLKTVSVRRAGLAAWICLLIVYVVWGSTYLAIRVGVETMPPLLMAAARSLAAGLIMFPLGLRRRRSAPLDSRWPSRPQWRWCAAAGVLLLVGQGVVGVAERTIPSGLAALLVATVPLWLLGLDAGLNSVTGVLIVLGAAGMWALGTMTARRGTFPSSMVLATGIELLAGGVALLILAAVTGEFGSLHLGHVSAGSWLALGYLIVFGSIVAFSAYGIAVRSLPTPTVATYAYVNPVIAVLLGALILGERLTPAMIGGGILVVGAVVLVVRRSPPAH